MADDKKKKDFVPSWLLVIFMLGLFWPLGLYFLWCKLRAIEPGAKKRDRRLSGAAAAMAIIGAFALFSMDKIYGAFLMAGGAALFLYDLYEKKRDQRLTRYIACTQGRNTMDIREIARVTGVDYDTACKDLQKLIDEKKLGLNAYLDYSRGLYVRDGRFAPKGEPPRQEPEKGRARTEEGVRMASPYLSLLEDIRRANQAIKNEKVSGQIRRIEQITGSIFDVVSRHPEKKSQIHTFLNYYLPTTLKLLSSYAQLERQVVAGENITSSKARIEELLDKLVWAFEQQNDQMFAQEAMDLNADIRVMETMLARDGLSEDGLPRRPFAKAVSTPSSDK